jgi:hypothetical protein
VQFFLFSLDCMSWYFMKSLTRSGSCLSGAPFLQWSAAGWGLDRKMNAQKSLCWSSQAAIAVSPIGFPSQINLMSPLMHTGSSLLSYSVGKLLCNQESNQVR